MYTLEGQNSSIPVGTDAEAVFIAAQIAKVAWSI